MSNTLVSVIIPSFKMARFLGDALASVAVQTHRQWEVIVVDDAGPEDGTRAMVEAFAENHPGHRVEYIRHETNQGVSAARNTAMTAAQGAFFAFLDADDIWYPRYLEATTAALTANSSAAAANARMVLFGELANRAFVKDEPFVIQDWQIERFPLSLAMGNFINPSATLVRREAMEKVGSFDTDPCLQHTEDYDLWLRMAEAKMEFVFLDEILVRYRRHPTAASADPALMAQLEKAVVEKHAVFINICLRRLLRSLYFRHENLEKRIKRPFRWLRFGGKREG